MTLTLTLILIWEMPVQLTAHNQQSMAVMGMKPLVKRAVSASHGVGGIGWGVGLFCAFHTLRHSSCLVVRIREFLREVRSSCSELSINVHLGEVSELGGGEPCVLSQ